ncbi:hypothetical protein HD554DRAFT_1086031 [Boletus coccyginus]|nr:hypothetical protein HD554DRAFT_1086031 [Boletus coccyginus]
MIGDFWVTIESHSWRHDPSKYRQRALLVYQGRIHKDWHKTLGTTDAFRLLPLHAGRLNEYHQELLDNVYATKIEAILSTTRHYSPLSSSQPLTTSAPFKLNHSRSSSLSKRPMSPPSKDHPDAAQSEWPRSFCSDAHSPPPTLQPTRLSRHAPKRPQFHQCAPSVLADINTRCPSCSAQPSLHEMKIRHFCRPLIVGIGMRNFFEK